MNIIYYIVLHYITLCYYYTSYCNLAVEPVSGNIQFFLKSMDDWLVALLTHLFEYILNSNYID